MGWTNSARERGERLLIKEGEEGWVEEGVGGDGAITDSGDAVPGGEAAAGFGDDRGEGGDIPEVHLGVEHDIGAA